LIILSKTQIKEKLRILLVVNQKIRMEAIRMEAMIMEAMMMEAMMVT